MLQLRTDGDHHLSPPCSQLGDYHYKGLTGEPPQMEKAAGFYQAAAESQISAMAYFNLGYMYEHGLGVPQVSPRHRRLSRRDSHADSPFPPRTGISPNATTTSP
jgi:hypothetical protein